MTVDANLRNSRAMGLAGLAGLIVSAALLYDKLLLQPARQAAELKRRARQT